MRLDKVAIFVPTDRVGGCHERRGVSTLHIGEPIIASRILTFMRGGQGFCPRFGQAMEGLLLEFEKLVYETETGRPDWR